MKLRILGWIGKKLTFPELIRDFEKLHYIKGVGKKTLMGIIKACELSGNKITGTYLL